MGIFSIFCSSPEKKLEKILNHAFDDNVKSVLRKCDNGLIAGVITFHCISSTYDRLKSRADLISMCGLSKAEYLRILDNCLERTMTKYISNWHEMKRHNELQRQAYEEDRMMDSFFDDF